MKRKLFWAIAAGLSLLIFVTIYVVNQQTQRSQANWPQIQLAQDTASAINRGQLPENLVENQVDMVHSLAPFVIVYDQSGRVVAGSGTINNQIPTIPMGVLTSAAGKDYNAVTWQPQDGVRIAAVSVKADGYYVMSGRSLKEVEKAEQQSLILTAIGLAGAMLVLAVGYILAQAKRNGTSKKPSH